jgi:hypothetical protein
MLRELAMASTCFNHKRVHKGTWKMPGSEQTSQTDHVLVSRRHGSSKLNVKTARGPNCHSDQI